MNTAIFSVAYPGIEPFFSDLLNSLSCQTDTDFTLFLLNDGVSHIDTFFMNFDRPVKIKKGTGTSANLRKTGIQWAIDEGSELIVFSDADDYFEENRVEVSKKILAHSEVVFNDMILVGEHILRPVSMLNPRFSEGEQISVHHLKSANCMGLSNTAIRTHNIPESVKDIPDDIIAFDWAFFTLCLHSSIRATFTECTHTYYRQYGNNIASPRFFAEKQIMRGVRVKRDHYMVLSGANNTYSNLAATFSQLLEHLEHDPALRSKYCQAIRAQSPPSPLWWEPIKTLEELGL